MKPFVAPAVLVAVLAAVAPAADPPPPSGDSVIREKVGPSDLVITTTSRLAGAIHSLTWNGREFVDSADHGRQIQSASNLDCGRKMIAEVFNPTEAGSMHDGAGPTSTSRLLKLEASGNALHTVTRMAFWLRPGEKSQGHPARNTVDLSDHVVSKRVRIGYKALPHAIPYDVTFTVPKGERHTAATFEAVTGYMPWAFNTVWAFDPAAGKLVPLPDKANEYEQRRPVVLATAGERFAMGVYSPDQPSTRFEAAGYGRFKFPKEKVTKWNCVFRVADPDGVAAGDYSYRCFVVVGTVADCSATIAALHTEFAAK